MQGLWGGQDETTRWRCRGLLEDKMRLRDGGAGALGRTGWDFEMAVQELIGGQDDAI